MYLCLDRIELQKKFSNKNEEIKEEPISNENFKAEEKKTSKKEDKKNAKIPASPKKEPFLDFDKDIEIGDNRTIERVLTKEQLVRWNQLKDDDDTDDLGESNLKQIARKFIFCNRDIEKKKARGPVLVREHSLISFETIAKDHPALKYLDQQQVVDILRNRDIEVHKIKKQILKGTEKADKIYFILFGMVKVQEVNQCEYYGIIKTGWPIGEEIFLDKKDKYIDSAQAGAEVGMIYITLAELKQIEEKMDPKVKYLF